MAMEAVLPLRSPEDCLFAKPLPQHGGHIKLLPLLPKPLILSLSLLLPCIITPICMSHLPS